MGDWHEVKNTLYKRDGSPCNGCLTGGADISEKWEDGKLYQKFDYCQETCERYLGWEKDPEHFLGDNVRDAIKVIRR